MSSIFPQYYQEPPQLGRKEGTEQGTGAGLYESTTAWGTFYPVHHKPGLDGQNRWDPWVTPL